MINKNTDIRIIKRAVIKFAEKWKLDSMSSLELFMSKRFARIIVAENTLEYLDDYVIYLIESTLCVIEGKQNYIFDLPLTNDLESRVKDLCEVNLKFGYDKSKDSITLGFIETIMNAYYDGSGSNTLNDLYNKAINNNSSSDELTISSILENEVTYKNVGNITYSRNSRSNRSSKVMYTSRPMHNSNPHYVEENVMLEAKILTNKLIKFRALNRRPIATSNQSIIIQLAKQLGKALNREDRLEFEKAFKSEV